MDLSARDGKFCFSIETWHVGIKKLKWLKKVTEASAG